MCKSDIKEAFRLLPIKKDCHNLLGFKLRGFYFYDMCMPMGASSSCMTFERFSDALKFILCDTYKVRHVVKVLDDFLFIGETAQECEYGLQSFRHLCKLAGIPIAEEKTEGPTRVIIFLGIQIDTVNWEISIPQEKVIKYRNNIQQVLENGEYTLRHLKQIIGQLSFVTRIIPAGRCFLRRLHNATVHVRRLAQVIPISSSARADLEMWLNFLRSYNGKEILRKKPDLTSKDLHFYADASPNMYGAVFGKYYLQGIFLPSWRGYNIMVLEMYPIYVMMMIFDDYLAGKSVIFHTDNQALVTVLNNQTTRHPMVMHMLRPLVLSLLQKRIKFTAVHIPGKKNITCDDLSRRQDLSRVRGLPWDATPLPLPSCLRPHNLRLE